MDDETVELRLSIMRKQIDELQAVEKGQRAMWIKVVLSLVLTFGPAFLGIVYQAGRIQSSIDEQARMLTEIRSLLPAIQDHETRLRLIESRYVPMERRQ